MLKHECEGAEDSQKLDQLVQSFLEYKIFRIYNSPQQLQDIEKKGESMSVSGGDQLSAM